MEKLKRAVVCACFLSVFIFAGSACRKKRDPGNWLRTVSEKKFETLDPALARDPFSRKASSKVGPFILERASKDQIVWKKNPNYLNASAIKVDGIQEQIQPREDLRVKALLENEVDFLFPVPASFLSRVFEDGGQVRKEMQDRRLKVSKIFHLEETGLVFQSARSAFQGPRGAKLKHALEQCIDYGPLESTLLKNTGEGNKKKIPFSLVDAKAYRQESGFESELLFLSRMDDWHKAFAEYLRKSWELAGFKIKIEYANATEFSDRVTKGSYDLTVVESESLEKEYPGALPLVRFYDVFLAKDWVSVPNMNALEFENTISIDVKSRQQEIMK